MISGAQCYSQCDATERVSYISHPFNCL
jgi:hypothetical protein